MHRVSTYAWTIYTEKENTKQIFLEVMLKESDLNEVVVLDQEENITSLKVDMLKVVWRNNRIEVNLLRQKCCV